ncbi:MAG: FAD-binding oxidoreductase [Chloroflexota bacterium]|nr:FAD-binding oxidoreductase [Chloroflexota bacterium]MDE3192176.1 FAD-binding oxidoreductase [Chloroflexota bacterium]
MTGALPRTASTVVVGGGIVGAAAAFFLADRGERDVLLLEREGLGAGTTKGGMGGIRHQFVDEIDVRMSLLAVEFWRDFASFTGSAWDFEERGYLFLASTPAGLAKLKQPLGLYERLGLDVRMLDRADVEELVPGLRVDDLAGARFCARDGYGDPLSALAGFAAGAVLEGVRVAEGTTVRSLAREGDRVTGVRTDDGDVSAERVLLATGCWTAEIAATADVDVPISAFPRRIAESAPLPALAGIPMVVEHESGFHFRPKDGALHFAMPDLTAEAVRERAARRYPKLADLRVERVRDCRYELTPDDHPVLGRVPGARGLYLAAGFSGHGFMHAPATAQLIVEEMLDGRATTLDIADLSIDRFRTGTSRFTGTVL